MRAGDRAGETAATLILVGLILDIIGEVILLFIGFATLVFGIGVILLALALVGFVWIALVWAYSYSRVKAGDYAGARTPTLVFAILSLITLALIPGILFLIAYLKLGDALAAGAAAPSHAWGAMPYTPAPVASAAPAPRFCSHCGRPAVGTAAFCEGCGAPLS